MAFTDWESVKSLVEWVVALSTTTPIAGSTSLRLDNVNNPGPGESSVTLRLSSAWPRGFTAGRVRTLFKASSNSTWLGGYTGLFGVLCMMSTADVLASGSCYHAGLWTSNPSEWRIYKFTSGIQASGGTLLASGTTTNNLTAYNTVRAVELEWRADSAQLGGTRLILRVGTAADFSDLTTLYDIIDASSPLLTSVGEGLCEDDVPGNPRREWLVDQTTIVQLA